MKLSTLWRLGSTLFFLLAGMLVISDRPRELAIYWVLVAILFALWSIADQAAGE